MTLKKIQVIYKMYIPHEIYGLISDFLFGSVMKENIFSSLYHQISARKLIPPIFLKQRVPLRKYYTEKNKNAIKDIDFFSIPNPFLHPHPWCPGELLQETEYIDIEFMNYVIELLDPLAIKQIRTKKHYLRRSAKYLGEYISSGFLWNFRYAKLLTLLSDRNNFLSDLENPADIIIVHRVTNQVSSALLFWQHYNLA